MGNNGEEPSGKRSKLPVPEIDDQHQQAVGLATQQIGACYFLSSTIDVDMDEIMGVLFEERGLPAIVERDARIEQLQQTYITETDKLETQLEHMRQELKELRSENDRLQAEKKAASSIGSFQGAGAAIVAMSRIGKTRASLLTGWSLFQPYALQYIGRSASLSTRSIFLPRPYNILDRLEAARQDLEANTGPPPGLVGGNEIDIDNATNVIKMDGSELDAMVFVADKPYTPEFLTLLLRRLQLRHQYQSPSIQRLFKGTSRRLILHNLPVSPDENDEKADVPPAEQSTVVGVVNFGKWPNVYSWHPMENLLVVYTWQGLEDINPPLDPQQVLSALQSTVMLTEERGEPWVEMRKIYRSNAEGHLGPLTIKLVRTLLNGALTIDLGLASSSSALYPDTTPTDSDIKQIRLEDFGEFVSDLDQSRLLWEALEKGELF